MSRTSRMGALSQRFDRLSLRLRLTLAIVLLTGAGLLLAGAVTYHYLDAFLMRRVDQQVDGLQSTAQRLVRGGLHGPGFGDQLSLPNGSWVQAYAPDGTLAETIHPYGQPTPMVDGVGRAIRAAHVDARGVAPLMTLHGDHQDYRVRAVVTNFGVLVWASSLHDAEATLHRLLVVELIVGLLVVLAAGAGAAYIVRVGLRPLDEIGETAGAIAAGDLSRRVAVGSERTEVGRLGVALNAMLGQIERAFDERRRSEERLRRFLSDASHELRTPLTSIRGYSELFRLGAADRPEDLAKAMRRIEQEAARMGVLVDDMLLLARLEEGRPLDRQPVELARLVVDAVDDARAVEPDRPIEVDVQGEVVVLGDEGRLRQVLGNLLGNVRVHTPAGAPARVSLSVARGQALVSVADTGPGVDAGNVARVFERFYRADPSRTRASGGAGLGLAIVAAIVAAHDGRVAVEARPEGGALFRIELPLAPADEDEQPQLPAVQAAPSDHWV